MKSEEAEQIFNKLIDKGEDQLSPEELRLFALLAKLLEEYETRVLPKIADVSPSEALRFLMEENDLNQSDMLDIFGSQSAVSRALNGSRRIGPEHAKKLAKRFRVSAELFI
jgi:HTH-type transcriptional regulator/antitoxin HigA